MEGFVISTFLRDGFTAKVEVVSFAKVANSLLKDRAANSSSGICFFGFLLFNCWQSMLMSDRDGSQVQTRFPL